jgi:hypothetical protein
MYKPFSFPNLLDTSLGIRMRSITQVQPWYLAKFLTADARGEAGYAFHRATYGFKRERNSNEQGSDA